MASRLAQAQMIAAREKLGGHRKQLNFAFLGISLCSRRSRSSPALSAAWSGQEGKPERRLWAGSVCPFAQKGRIALREKEIEAKEVVIDLSDKPDEFVRLYSRLSPEANPVAKTPVFEDGKVGLIESDVVSYYMAEKYEGQGEPLLPTDATEKAKLRLFHEVWGSVQPKYTALLRSESWEAVDASRKALLTSLKTINSFLLMYGSWDPISPSSLPFMWGSTLSLAEVTAAPFIARMIAVLPNYYGIDLRGEMLGLGLHRALAWVDGMVARESVQATTPTTESLVEHAAEKFIALKK